MFVIAFLLAVQFLTRVPVSIASAISDKQLGLSVLFYPLIGLLIGAAMFLLATVLSHVAMPVQAALLLAFWVMVTGGLHLDGLADCADAWAGGFANPQRSLEIMKDPAAGPIAVIGLVLLLLLKWVALAELLAKPQLADLLVVPMLGRAAILGLMLSAPYLRENGLGAVLMAHLPAQPAKTMLVCCALLGVYSLGFLPMLFAVLMLLAVRTLALHRLGGVTGDVYGAAVELVEVAALLGLVIA